MVTAVSRQEAFAALVAGGMSLTDIGTLVGISRQRVQQILGPERARRAARSYSVTAVLRGIRDSRTTSWGRLGRVSGLSARVVRQVVAELDLTPAVLRLFRARLAAHTTPRSQCQCTRCKGQRASKHLRWRYANGFGLRRAHTSPLVDCGQASAGRYTNYGCRCTACTQAQYHANAQYRKRRVQAEREAPQATDRCARPSVYRYRYGCRCTGCRAAVREYRHA